MTPEPTKEEVDNAVESLRAMFFEQGWDQSWKNRIDVIARALLASRAEAQELREERDEARNEAGSLREMFVRPQHANAEIESMLTNQCRRADRAENKAVELYKALGMAMSYVDSHGDERTRAICRSTLAISPP